MHAPFVGRRPCSSLHRCPAARRCDGDRSAQRERAAQRIALDAVKADSAWTLDQQISICEIRGAAFQGAGARRGVPAPARVARLAQRADRRGGQRHRRASLVAGSGPSVMLAGHLDTVFPEGTDVKVKRVGARLTSPGIGDDCRGLAVVLTVARAFQSANVQTTGTVYFVGDVGEEGPGNLRRCAAPVREGAEGKGRLLHLGGRSRARAHHPRGGQQSLQDHLQRPGWAQLLGVRYCESDSRPRPRDRGDRRRTSAEHAEDDVQRWHDHGRHVSELHSVRGERGAGHALRIRARQLAKLDRRIQAILRTALAAENARWGAGSAGRAGVDASGRHYRHPSRERHADGQEPDRRHGASRQRRRSASRPRSGAASTDANLPMSMGIARDHDGGRQAAEAMRTR